MSDLGQLPVAEPETPQIRLPVPLIVTDEAPPAGPPPPGTETEPQPERAERVLVALAAAEPTIPFVVGPSGGKTGRSFSTGVLPADAEVRRIWVRHGALVKAVGIAYELNGAEVTLGMHGGEKGELDSVDLARGEHVTRIEGRYGRYVDSLVIHTSAGRSHEFGGDGGTVHYEYDAPQGLEICGFGGSAGDLLNGVGPMYRQPPAEAGWDSRDIVRQGPSGDFGGTCFEDSPLPDAERIIGVRLWFGPRLDGIALLYGSRTDPRVLGSHGRQGGHCEELWLDDDEYIVGLSGCYASTVRCVRILTNKRLSRPFGWENEGVAYNFKTNAVDGPNAASYEVVGLFGRDDEWINALGVIFRRRRITQVV